MDGSCKDSVSGWAALMYLGNEKVVICGREFNSDSCRAELHAMIDALEMAINSQMHSIIVTDSAYVANPIKFNFFKKWKKRGYSGVKNLDLWKRIDELIELSSAEIRLIDRKFNSEADKFSKLARKGTYGNRAVISW